MKQKIANIALVVRDYDEAIAFYTQTLHFNLLEDTDLGGDKRWVRVAPPGASETCLLLAKAANPEQESAVGSQTGGRVFLFLHTDDFWRDYNEMQARGVRFVEEPRYESYGTVVVFEDLYGNKWDFIEPKPVPQYRWLLFDVDDTLFDFTSAESRSLEMTFRDLNLPFDPAYAGVYREVNQAVWKEFEDGKLTSIQLRIERFARLFARTGLSVDPESFSRRYLINLGSCSELIEGAEETIAALRDKYRLGLVTNGLSDVQRPRLAGSPLAQAFEVLAISEEIGAAKPDPRFFDTVFAQMGHPDESEVLVIGDSVSSDIQGAFNYGLDACRFNPRGLPADPRFPVVKEIRDLRELIAWLGKQTL